MGAVEWCKDRCLKALPFSGDCWTMLIRFRTDKLVEVVEVLADTPSHGQ